MDEVLHLLIGPVFYLIDLHTRADLFILLTQHTQLTQAVFLAQLEKDHHAKEQKQQNTNQARCIDQRLTAQDSRSHFNILRCLATTNGQCIHDRHNIQELERRQEGCDQQRLFCAGDVFIIEDLEREFRSMMSAQPEYRSHSARRGADRSHGRPRAAG